MTLSTPRSNDSTTPAWSRRRFTGLAGLVIGAAVISRLPATAQDDETVESTPEITSNQPAEMPTSGGLRPGPVGDGPPASVTVSTAPVSIMVEAAGIDAEIETLDILDGRLTDPTGPWVVTWYRQSAELGELGNILMAGHVDYWGVGPSVFYHVRDLVEGDVVQITGENDEVFTYEVQWNETFLLADLVTGTLGEIVAPTDDQVLTLFTCGGEFDYVNGEYLSRTVVRARRIIPEPLDESSGG